jgi:sialic acid synthase SpsE
MSLTGKITQIIENLRLPPRVKIGKTYVGPKEPVFVIAEIGINHNGSVETAKQLMKAAKEAGANAVKFQKRNPEEILIKEFLERPYESPNAFAPTYGEHREKLAFSADQYEELKTYADSLGVLFFASVWDFSSTDFMEKLGVDAYKIPSADVTNLPLLEYVATKNRPVLLSTGMSTLEEIDQAVGVILKKNQRLIIFNCTSLYPCPPEKVNLRFMEVIKNRYKPLPFGYSGHEMGRLPTLAAVSMGAQIVERHFTLDKTMKGSDQAASLEPHELKEVIKNIKEIELAKGGREKIIYEELNPVREKLAKSIASAVDIPKGTLIREEMLCVKGPGSGIKPVLIREVIGKEAQQEIKKDTIIPLQALGWPKGRYTIFDF